LICTPGLDIAELRGPLVSLQPPSHEELKNLHLPRLSGALAILQVVLLKMSVQFKIKGLHTYNTGLSLPKNGKVV
jgi:hypothetical protein